ncbi:MAG: vitamin B12 dependent-methionine synthase activation domain-containing protein [Dehalococcoidia bacterium]|nr:vitamin B12 dependent-methionine synthase activation domain-containing protein [Dehalococcoidia bacterium]
MESTTVTTGVILLDRIPFKPEPEAVMKAMRVRRAIAQIEDMVKEMVTQAQAIARPRVIYRVSHVQHVDESSVDIDGVRFTSRVLSKCLLNLNRAFPCICTCGREIDKWVVPANDVMRGYCLETIKTFAVGAAIQFIASHLKETYAPGQLSHMNPGEFGDWPITQQRPLFSIFGDTEKLIGVTLTDSYMMKPLKSRSGIYFANEEGFESCQFCPVKKCPGRRARYQPEKLKDYGVQETTVQA